MICKGYAKDLQERIDHVRAMDAYEWETDEGYCYWIENGVPDAASDDDIRFIAENMEVYAEVCEAYIQAKLIDIFQREG